MVEITRRPVSTSERSTHAPGALARLFKRPAAESEVELISFEVSRFWDITACTPGCCPNSWLFEATDGTFVGVESWELFAFKSGSVARRSIQIERLGRSHRILAARLTGPELHPEALPVRDHLIDLLETECELFARPQLPPSFLSAIGAS